MPGPVFGAFSGTDYIPVSWSTPAPTAILIDDDPDHIPFYAEIVRGTPSYANALVRGPSTQYAQDAAQFGLVTFTISTSHLGSMIDPPYLPVVVNGLQYRIQVGVPVTLPKNVMDVINASSDFRAT